MAYSEREFTFAKNDGVERGAEGGGAGTERTTGVTEIIGERVGFFAALASAHMLCQTATDHV